MSNDVAESINQQLIAGRFGHVGLRQLHTKLFCMHVLHIRGICVSVHVWR